MSKPALAEKFSSGIIPDLSRKEYEEIGAENFSALKEFAKSPAHYQSALTVPRGDTDALRLGRAIHTLVFEPKTYEERVAIWSGGTRRGKEWDIFVGANVGKDILKEDEADEAGAIAVAITQKLSASGLKLSSGQAEPTLLWEDGGFRLKGRPDWVGPEAIIDLKSARNASPEAFGRECALRFYHAQAALYADGVQAVLGERRPYYIVAAEKCRPYDVVVYRVSESIIDAGRDLYRGWLMALEACRKSGKWPGYDSGSAYVPLTLPAWSVPMFDIED